MIRKLTLFKYFTISVDIVPNNHNEVIAISLAFNIQSENGSIQRFIEAIKRGK